MCSFAARYYCFPALSVCVHVLVHLYSRRKHLAVFVGADESPISFIGFQLMHFSFLLFFLFFSSLFFLSQSHMHLSTLVVSQRLE